MADHRYGNPDRSRGGSIFSDDDSDRNWRSGGGERWRSEDRGWGGADRGRSSYGGHGHSGGGQDDRGFFSRAGDEVRSWFGDEEAERRREMDARRQEQEHGLAGPYRGGGHEDQWTGGHASRADSGRNYERSQMRSNWGGQSGGYGHDNYGQSSYGQSSQGGAWQGGRSQGGWSQSGQPGQSYGQSGQGAGGSHHDETYRRWREQQIEALDREYEEYCQHRQQQFEHEFSAFRQTRQGITSGGATMSQNVPTGSTEFSSSSGATAGEGGRAGGLSGGQNAGSITTGAGNASAATSSTGSSGPATATTGSASGRSRKR